MNNSPTTVGRKSLGSVRVRMCLRGETFRKLVDFLGVDPMATPHVKRGRTNAIADFLEAMMDDFILLAKERGYDARVAKLRSVPMLGLNKNQMKMVLNPKRLPVDLARDLGIPHSTITYFRVAAGISPVPREDPVRKR